MSPFPRAPGNDASTTFLSLPGVQGDEPISTHRNRAEQPPFNSLLTSRTTLVLTTSMLSIASTVLRVFVSAMLLIFGRYRPDSFYSARAFGALVF